jgi:surfeit locus 1 family protein
VTRRDAILLVLALAVAAVCVRLGIWQLQRLSERRAYNATVLSAIGNQAVPLDSLRGDAEGLRYRPVKVTGRYDIANELVVANRPRRGSPGVHIVTPLLRVGTDTAVLVIRGWVYAPDAAHADLERWREDSADAAVGYLQSYDEGSTGQPSVLEGRILRQLGRDDAAAAVPYPIAAYVVVLTAGEDTVAGAPPRLDSPVLGEGNHMSYAFQWFAFAAVALGGTAVFLRQSRRSATTQSDRFDPR